MTYVTNRKNLSNGITSRFRSTGRNLYLVTLLRQLSLLKVYYYWKFNIKTYHCDTCN